MRLLSVVSISLAVMCVALSGAISAEPTAPLTWEDCVKSAMQSNPDIREARFRLDSATSSRSAAFGGFLPRFSASVGTGDKGAGNNPDLNEIDMELWQASLDASQSLFSGFSTLSDVRRNMAAVRKAEASLRADSADTRNRLRRAFANLLYAQENIRLLENIAVRRKDNSDLVNLRYEGGRENRGSALRVAADARQAQFEVSKAKRALSLAQRQLARETGLGEFSPLSVKGIWDVTPPPDSADLEALAKSIPAVQQAAAGADEARASLWSAIAPYWPSVDASAGIGRDASTGGREPEWVPETRSWNAGFKISYSLFNGAKDSYKALAANADDNAALEALAASQKDARVTLEEALNSYLDAYENVGVRKQYLDAAVVRAEIGRAQYANGMLSFTQWDLIETELVDSERGYLAARRDALYTEAAWNRALGLELGK